MLTVAVVLSVVIVALVVAVSGSLDLCTAAPDQALPLYCGLDPRPHPVLSGDIADDFELLQVHVVLRHGSRSTWRSGGCWEGDVIDKLNCTDTHIFASHSIPGRQFRARHLPGKTSCPPGHLLAQGYEQVTALGRMLANVYVGRDSVYNFLSTNEGAGSFYLRSSNMQRTLTTGQTFFDAFYPHPLAAPLDWLTMDFEVEPIRGGYKGVCAKYEGAVAEAKKSPEFTSMVAAASPIFERLASVTQGTDLKYDDVEFLIDCFFVHACNRLPVPCPFVSDNYEVRLDGDPRSNRSHS